jgi:hypothetical protein
LSESAKQKKPKKNVKMKREAREEEGRINFVSVRTIKG